MYFKICFKWIITTPWKTILDAGCINKHTHVPYASISYNHIKPLKDKYIVINIILRGWVRKKAIHVFFSFASSQAFGTSCFNLFVNITFAFTYVAINSMKPAISRISITDRSFFFLLRVLLEFFFFFLILYVSCVAKILLSCCNTHDYSPHSESMTNQSMDNIKVHLDELVSFIGVT